MVKNMFHQNRLVFKMGGSLEKKPTQVDNGIEGSVRIEPDNPPEVKMEDRTAEWEAQAEEEIRGFFEGEDMQKILGDIKEYFDSGSDDDTKYKMAVDLLKDKLKEVDELGEDVRDKLGQKIDDALFSAAGTEIERVMLFEDVYGKQEEGAPLKSVKEQMHDAGYHDYEEE